MVIIMGAVTPFGMGDKVQAVHTRKGEDGKVLSSDKVKTKDDQQGVIGLVQQIPENRFCFECGEKLNPLVILYCKQCGQRYLVQYDDVLKKPIVVPIGKEEALKKLGKEEPESS